RAREYYALSLHDALPICLKLCQRGRAGFVLTEEGREIYEASLRLLASVETFRSEVNSTHKELHGSLNIGITDNLVTLPHMEITKDRKSTRLNSSHVSCSY